MIGEPQQEPGKRKALALAIGVHALLALALFLGVQWKRSTPDTVEVELWAPTPRQATSVPPPTKTPPTPKPEKKPEPKPEPKPVPKPEPKPTPPPDIKVKKEVEKKPEPKPKEVKPKPEEKKPEPPKKQPTTQPLFQDQIDQELKHAKQNQTTPTRNAPNKADVEQQAAAAKKGQEEWAGKISRKIKGNVILPPNLQGNPESVFEVHLLPTGEVLNVRLKRSSGNPALDAAVERAILKASPLPKPDNPAIFQRDLDVRYRPLDE